MIEKSERREKGEALQHGGRNFSLVAKEFFFHSKSTNRIWKG